MDSSTLVSSEEEIVLTPWKKGKKTTIVRIERTKADDVDYDGVFYISNGPHEGVIINKCVEDLPELENADHTVSFVASMYNKRNKDHNEYRELRRLQLWLKQDYKAYTSKPYEYFKELIVPEGFPKNSNQFLKKALALFISYPMLQVVNVEIRPTFKNDDGDDVCYDEDDECELETEEYDTTNHTEADVIEDVGPQEDLNEYPITNYITVLTPAKYDYQYLPEIPLSYKTAITFKVKASCDAYITLCSTYGDCEYKSYEFAIGEKSNFKSSIKDGASGIALCTNVTPNILSADDFRTFWISWSDNALRIGKGDVRNKDTFISMGIPKDKNYTIKCLAVSTGPGSNGVWEFAEYDEKAIVNNKIQKSKMRETILWLARKQKMIRVLEDAYPKSLDTNKLLMASKVELKDKPVAVDSLKQLEDRGLITQVASGVWMRAVTCVDEQQHVVKTMDQVLHIDFRDEPTVAIITSLFCEKQAVDSMIENKTSFVRHKTEGETNVYTVGRIGNVNVVSTKLSRRPTSEGKCSTIGAGNTITRLLGTFSKVEHILLVGVGGGIPNYSDYRKHSRLGDVLVSTPLSKQGPIYVNCQQIDKMGENEDVAYSYMTRTWECKDETLYKHAHRLRRSSEDDVYFNFPWDKYLEEATSKLVYMDSNFRRPSSASDRLIKRQKDGEIIEVVHPTPTRRMPHLYREGKSSIRYGPIGSGKFVPFNDDLKVDFAAITGVVGYDQETDAILDAIEGSRSESFILIRGVADYCNGQIGLTWQPHAALCAASYMKSLIMLLPGNVNRAGVSRGYYR